MSPPLRVVDKAVAYVVRAGHLLVFEHRDFPLTVTGVQVPAGTIQPGESPRSAALREAIEETGRDDLRVVRKLGVARYDVRPARDEVHRRHIFQLACGEPVDLDVRWESAEQHDGRQPPTLFVCYWIPLGTAHVLAAGQGALVGRIIETP